jgi:hypothetical protein
MIKLFSICIAVCLLSCEKPPAKLASDFSGWPIDMNGLISDMQVSTDGQIEIREEFEEKISPTVPYGCILFVPNKSEDSRKEVLNLASNSITHRLEKNGYKILSTDATSDKTDFRFVYEGKSTRGSITLKGLYEEEGVQLVIGILGE